MKDFKELKFSETEANLRASPGNYQGLQEEALYTSYNDLIRIMQDEAITGTWVDLGGGDGRTALLYTELFPARLAYSLEFCPERVSAGRKLIKNQRTHLLEGDLLYCDIPRGETYFLYFPTGIVLDRILHELGNMEHSFKIVVIESHGDLIARLKKEQGLRVIKEIALESARHYPCAIIFEKKVNLHQVSFKKRFLLIEENNERWWAESLGLEWLKDDLYQLSIPPRTIEEKSVKKVAFFEEIFREFHVALKLRPLGEFRFVTRDRIYYGHIRKIYESPRFEVEISTGERVEWGQVISIYQDQNLCYESSSDYLFLPHAQVQK